MGPETVTTGEDVTLHIDGDLATLTLNRPSKLNAMTSGMRREIAEHLATIDAQPNVRVIWVRAEGRAFCAGADLVDTPGTPLGWRRRVRTAQDQHLKLITTDKIVVATVQGAASGGGASIALSADILIMSEEARLIFPFVNLGLVPDGGASFLLIAKAGPGVANDILLTGGAVTADEARTWGLTRRVVARDALEAEGRKVCDTLLNLPPEGLMLTKNLSRQAWADELKHAFDHEVDAFALATSTDGHKKALEAIKAKLGK